MTAVCPHCKKDDAVQRVETLVASSRSSGVYSGPSGGATYSDGKWGSVGGYTTLSGSSTTDLAVLLAPPPMPTKSTGFLLSALGCLLAGSAATLALGAPITAFMVGGMASTFGESNGTLYTVFICVFTLVLLLAFGGFAFLLLRAGARQRKASDLKYPAELARWEKARSVWQRLYFCHRDGVVFDPETGESYEPSGMHEYIFR